VVDVTVRRSTRLAGVAVVEAMVLPVCVWLHRLGETKNG
jgi:hypothetical protein